MVSLFQIHCRIAQGSDHREVPLYVHEQTSPLRRSAPVETENDGVIEGRNAVIEALRAGVAIDKIFDEGRDWTPPWAISPPPPGKRASWWWTPTGASWTA